MQPIVIAAGGTGGHFFPAEALAAVLIARGHRVVLMTDSRSGALRSAVFAGHEQFVLHGSGIAGRGVLRGARAAFELMRGSFQARRILARLQPSAVIGFGGYPSLPPLTAARSLKRMPFIVLHEQNAVLGRANLFLSAFADLLALAVKDTARAPARIRTQVVGNPVRPAIAALHGLPYTPPGERIEILVLGGSLGARVFSDVVPASLAMLPQDLRVRLAVTQQCRTEDLARVRGAYHAAGIEAELAPFFDDVAAKLARAHLVIARAGASTVAEIAVVGRPAILVPLPGAIDDHQTANAVSLGGAVVIAQASFTPDRLAPRLHKLLTDRAWLEHAAWAASVTARADAAADLADLIEQHVAQAKVTA